MNRSYNLDLLRFLSMLGIIMVHLLGVGGVINNVELFSLKGISLWLALIICYCPVNIFAMLTGYLYVDRKIKVSSLIKLLFITFFYCCVILLIFYIFNLFGVKDYGIRKLITCLFPFTEGRYWYITCYSFLFLLIPYINKFIKSLNKKQYNHFLLIAFILLCVISRLFTRDIFVINSGYSPFWLIYLYIIGAYLNLYSKDLNKKLNSKKCLFITLFCLLIVIASKYVLTLANMNSDLLIAYTSPFIVIASICIIIMFNKIKIKNDFSKKIIYTLSKTSFSVYIIHANMLIYDNVISNIMSFSLDYNSVIIIMLIILIAILIYILCSIIDFFRSLIFKILKIDNLIDNSMKGVKKYVKF